MSKGKIVVTSLCCDVRRVDSEIGRRAAEWAQAFHPEISISIEDGRVRLSSPRHSDDQLRTIWLSSLANERLHARAATWRAVTLTALMQ